MRKIKRTTARTLAAVTFCVSLSAVSVVAWNTTSDATPSKRHVPVEERTLDLPRCSEFEGRYDGTCWYEDSNTDAVINFNHGAWTYDMDTGRMTHNVHAKG